MFAGIILSNTYEQLLLARAKLKIILNKLILVMFANFEQVLSVLSYQNQSAEGVL